ncbi:MAG: phosphoribosyl-AMP cyclohydrolase [Dehalococcoidales bacterium]|nr:phosphoribosyl-AMP cyclohydrolase [Dehalococcoidales bacterium]
MAPKFDAEGLLPCVTTQADTGEVLMLGYMNAESLRLTLSTGDVWFFSRSRQKLWHKGETSGNFLRVVKIWKDCENNSLLVRANPTGPVCHTGNRNCFFRELEKEDIPTEK